MTFVHHTGSKLLDEIAAKRDRNRAAWWPENKALPMLPPVSKPTQAFVLPKQRETAPPLQLTSSSLDQRFIFTNFFTNDGNRLAWVEAQRAASAPIPIYNPLYIHAPVGFGKTHLLQAIVHAHGAGPRRALYLTAERFIYSFLSAIKAQTASAFRESLRSVDILVVDDVQFLLGKAMQEEFRYTIDALLDSPRQVVVAADRSPSDLESLEERIRSRLSGGLCVEIGALDKALRVKILEARIAAAKLMHRGFDVPPEVIAHVASLIQTNGRDLDGAANRLIAHAYLNGGSHSIETAELAISGMVRTPDPKKVKIDDIQKLVARNFNVTRDDILSARRTANLVRPRQIAMYLSKVLTPRSLPEIGRRFGGRDHTTILHAVRKIAKLIEGGDTVLCEEVSILREMLIQ